MKFYTTLLLYISSSLSSTSALKDQQVPTDEEDEERHATVLRKGSRSARGHSEIVRLDNNNRLNRKDWWRKNLNNGKWCGQGSECKSKCCHKAVCKSSCPPKLPRNGASCYMDIQCSSQRCNNEWKCQKKALKGEFCQWGYDHECENGLSCSKNDKCYHLPRREYEPCGPTAKCDGGLFCEFPSYKCKKRIGEFENCELEFSGQCKDGMKCILGEVCVSLARFKCALYAGKSYVTNGLGTRAALHSENEYLKCIKKASLNPPDASKNKKTFLTVAFTGDAVLLEGAGGVIYAAEGEKISKIGTFSKKCRTKGVGFGMSVEIGESYMSNKEDFAGVSACKTVEVAVIYGGGSLSICSSGDGPSYNTQWSVGPIMGTSLSLTDSDCVTKVFWD